MPSAKMTVWNEALFYFQLAPRGFRKILFVLHDKRNGSGESLLSYYQRTYPHLIPDDVEFIELDENSGRIVKDGKSKELSRCRDVRPGGFCD